MFDSKKLSAAGSARLRVGAIALAVSGLILAAPTSTRAQEDPDSTRVVMISGKSPLAAGLLEAWIPTVGYAYAGNWTRGLLPLAARVASLAIGSDGLGLSSSPPCDARCRFGQALFIGTTLLAAFDAGNEARRFNERERARASMAIVPDFGPNGVGVGIRIALGN